MHLHITHAYMLTNNKHHSNNPLTPKHTPTQAPKVRSPESVSGLSLGGRSSIARSVAGSSVRPGSAAKVDRVTRYKQLQQGWSKDKFLSSATHGSRPSSAPQRAATTATKRKPMNFHAHFQMLHAAEAQDRKRTLSQARAKTMSDLKFAGGSERLWQ